MIEVGTVRTVGGSEVDDGTVGVADKKRRDDVKKFLANVIRTLAGSCGSYLVGTGDAIEVCRPIDGGGGGGGGGTGGGELWVPSQRSVLLVLPLRSPISVGSRRDRGAAHSRSWLSITACFSRASNIDEARHTLRDERGTAR